MLSKSTALVVLCLLGLGQTQPGYAQARDEAKDPQLYDDVSTLKNDFKILRTEQQQIINELSELKRLVQLNSADRPTPHPPTTLGIRGEGFKGDSTANVAIIEYADFECPYCGRYAREVYPQILSDYIQTGKLKYFYRDLPLPMHPHAIPAARAAHCAGEQGKYWEMHDSLFAKQNALSAPAILDRAQTLGLDTTKFSECLSSDRYTKEIQESAADAQKIGIEGTPTFFIGTIVANGDVNIDKRFVGTAPYEAFKTELDTLLAKTR